MRLNLVWGWARYDRGLLKFDVISPAWLADDRIILKCDEGSHWPLNRQNFTNCLMI